MNVFKYNYKTTLPNEANAPLVEITGNIVESYEVVFNELIYNHLNELEMVREVGRNICKTNESTTINYTQSFVNWHIQIILNGVIVSEDIFNPSGKVIFIKIDASALGDNIAWIPYVDLFSQKFNCTVICSTFYNELFVERYPHILFVKPNTNIDNVYAQYYVGASKTLNQKYAFVNSTQVPLQRVASTILGLEYQEINPNIIFNPPTHNKKYVCISEFASGPEKHWLAENGWQKIVDYLSTYYDVVVISREPTNLTNVINLSGDYSITERAKQLSGCEFFIGLSSGLSWLAWSVGKHVVMISDGTPIEHEFTTNITRICANPTLNIVDFTAPNVTEPEVVINLLKNYIKTNIV